jgi:hypothetical protein
MTYALGASPRRWPPNSAASGRNGTLPAAAGRRRLHSRVVISQGGSSENWQLLSHSTASTFHAIAQLKTLDSSRRINVISVLSAIARSTAREDESVAAPGRNNQVRLSDHCPQ